MIICFIRNTKHLIPCEQYKENYHADKQAGAERVIINLCNFVMFTSQSINTCICCYPDNRGFSWPMKNGEKRKTSEEIMSKSCWVWAISRPGVWTSHTGQTGCVTGFSLSCHSWAWTVSISAGQNRARLSKWPEKRFGSNLILKLYYIMFNRILTQYLQRFFFSPFILSQEKPHVIRVIYCLRLKLKTALVRVNSSRKHSPWQTLGIWKKLTSAWLSRQFSLTTSPIPTMMVKCPAPQSIKPIYKNISCHFTY